MDTRVIYSPMFPFFLEKEPCKSLGIVCFFLEKEPSITLGTHVISSPILPSFLEKKLSKSLCTRVIYSPMFPSWKKDPNKTLGNC